MEKKIPVTTDVKNLRHFNIYNKSTVQFEPHRPDQGLGSQSTR